MGYLAGKVAIITGASSGIGEAIARLFAAEGARVVLGARRGTALQTIATEIAADGGKATFLAGTVVDEAYHKALVALAIDRFGGLDIAVNNAGTMGAAAPVPDLSREDWQETLDTNLTAAFLAAKHQIPAMAGRGGGALVFTGSFVGHTVGFPGVVAYAAAKTGLIGLTKALAVETAEAGIRVNVLLPGGTETPMADAFAATPEALDAVRSLHLLKRIARPDEIARSALYLASDLSSFTTGTALLADGGISIFRG